MQVNLLQEIEISRGELTPCALEHIFAHALLLFACLRVASPDAHRKTCYYLYVQACVLSLLVGWFIVPLINLSCIYLSGLRLLFLQCHCKLSGLPLYLC